MLYYLVTKNLPWLESHGLGFCRLLTAKHDPFRATIAIVISFVTVLLLAPKVIAWLKKQKLADLATCDQAEIEKMNQGKKGTPTMGGVLILGAILAATLLLADLSNFYVEMALVCLLWLGVVGAIDDWLKLTVGRRSGSRQGLTGLEKLLFQIGLSVILCYFTYQHGQNVDDCRTFFFPLFKNAQVDLGLLAFIVIGTIVLTGTSNAVNLTDGMDGLAAGCMAIVSFVFFILALIAGTRMYGTEIASRLYLPRIEGSSELAILAGAMAGACLGFLWFNCNPAKIFMGDTGSLSLGGLIAYIAIVIRQEIILFVVGGVFVMEAASVIMQVLYFKYTRRRYGEPRRIFLCTPIHHHFQRKGWPEQQVVVRFWLMNATLAAIALASVKLR